LQRFLELCSTFTIWGVEEDAIHLRLFPFSLLGKAKQWFYVNRAGIGTWQSAQQRSLQSSSRWAELMSSGENFQLPVSRKWNHSKSLGETSRVHSGLSPLWDGQLAYSSKFL
jgi:hypothetical protein